MFYTSIFNSSLVGHCFFGIVVWTIYYVNESKRFRDSMITLIIFDFFIIKNILKGIANKFY